MYAQSNYPGVSQGIAPTRYTIRDIGCFITSFCNLMSRYGRNIDPPDINAFFRDKNLYIDIDDGCRDDVSWDFITKFNPNFTVSALGAGMPPTKDAIVKFIYNGGNSTHFCLVDHIDGNTVYVVDSWDGVVKNANAYGGVKAWASYNVNGTGADNMADQAIRAKHIGDIFKGITGNDISQKDLDFYISRPDGEFDLIYALLPSVKDIRDANTDAQKFKKKITDSQYWGGSLDALAIVPVGQSSDVQVLKPGNYKVN